MVFSLVSGSQLPNPQRFLSDGSNNGFFCYVNEVTFTLHPGVELIVNSIQAELRGLELSVLLPYFWGGEKVLRLNRSPVAND